MTQDNEFIKRIKVTRTDELKSVLKSKIIEQNFTRNKIRFLRRNCDTIIFTTNRLTFEQYSNVLKELRLRLAELSAEIKALKLQCYPEITNRYTTMVLSRLNNIVKELSL